MDSYLVQQQLKYKSTEWAIWYCFINFDRLYGLCKHLIYNLRECYFVDVYIDMNSILNSIFINKSRIVDYNAMTSAFINLAIHYKDFFKTKLNINARVFLVYSNNFPSRPRELITEYNYTNYLKYANNAEYVDLINHNCELLGLICKYIDNVYFIYDENQETAVLIKEIISDQYKYRVNAVGKYSVKNGFYPNIVITKDLYDYQLVSSDGYTFIIRPRKTDGEDKSWCVTKNNIYKAIKKELGSSMNNVPEYYELVSSGLLPMFFSIAGLKSRNIKSIHTYNKTIDIIATAIRNNTILNEYNTDPEYCIDTLSELSPKIAENRDLIIQRYNAIDLVQNHALYNMTPSAVNLRSSIVDLISPMSLRRINEQFFKMNPIELNKL